MDKKYQSYLDNFNKTFLVFWMKPETPGGKKVSLCTMTRASSFLRLGDKTLISVEERDGNKEKTVEIPSNVILVDGFRADITGKALSEVLEDDVVYNFYNGVLRRA